MQQALLPFYSTKQEGTGLGLPLCREIVEAHGGQLSIRNGVGSGLEVILRFPQLTAHGSLHPRYSTAPKKR
jgi:signal transduction histidine kinase